MKFDAFNGVSKFNVLWINKKFSNKITSQQGTTTTTTVSSSDEIQSIIKQQNNKTVISLVVIKANKAIQGTFIQ